MILGRTVVESDLKLSPTALLPEEVAMIIQKAAVLRTTCALCSLEYTTAAQS